MNKVIVQIPCLNEEAAIGKVIGELKKKLPSAQIIVYDNSSTDNSVKISKKLGAKVVHVAKKGKGNVVRKMFSEEINGDYFVMIDGDNTYDLKKINDMLKKFKDDDLDMLVAKRDHSQSKAYRKGHVIGNKFFTKFVNIFFGKEISDIFSGFRIFSKRFIKSFPLSSNEFEIEAELTIHALEQKMNVGEFVCEYKPRLEGSFSKLNTFRDGVKILKLILVLIKDEKPFFFFSLISLIFFVLSLLIGLPIIQEFYVTGLVDKLPSSVLSGLLMIISVLSFFTGLILDVIKKMRFENKKLSFLSFRK